MALPKLTNYLRANRKRLGLSQAEVAFLLGSESGAKVCRYEQLVREPGLETALAFEAIFQKPVNQLFPGLWQKIAGEVEGRAKTLVRKSDRRAPNRQSGRKRKALAATRKIRVKLFSREKVMQVFFTEGEGTKHALAEILAKRFPDELRDKLPPKRRPWMSEDSRMDIFDAVALALVFRLKKTQERRISSVAKTRIVG